MTLVNIALTTLTGRIRCAELATVAAALQVQVTRDFAPEWGAGAVVAALPFEAIPPGWTPVIVQDSMRADEAHGFHRTRAEENAYFLVPYGPTWSLAASHAVLCLLANPLGSGRIAAMSQLPGQGIVEYFLDVCAPCQDISGAYTIDGVVVSDFCTRAFFGGPGGRFSFGGGARAAFEPAPGGVVTWLADDGLLYQARSSGHGRIAVDGGFSSAGRGGLLPRELVEALTPGRLPGLANARLTVRLEEAARAAKRARMASVSRFRDDIEWRFGALSEQPATGGTQRRSKGYAERSGQQRAMDEAATTLRTAS